MDAIEAWMSNEKATHQQKWPLKLVIMYHQLFNYKIVANTWKSICNPLMQHLMVKSTIGYHIPS